MNKTETTFSAQCSRASCARLFESPVSQAKADMALRMHIGRVHRRNIMRVGEQHNGNGHNGNHNGNGHKLPSTTVERYYQKALALDTPVSAVPAKRKYQRRAPQVVEQNITVNFCPNCGCNIHRVATGIALADKL